MTVHCPTCTCEQNEPEPENRCEMAEVGCLGEDRAQVTACYSCGLDVCRGPDCSALVRYSALTRNRWVRMCRRCLADRVRWHEIAALSQGAYDLVSEDIGAVAVAGVPVTSGRRHA